MRLVLLAFVLAVRAAPADASCAASKPFELTLTVTTCKTVDTRKVGYDSYAGVLVTGTDKKGAAQTVWVPARAGVTCAALVPKAVATGTIDYACCDGDPNPPCRVGTAMIFTNVKVKKP